MEISRRYSKDQVLEWYLNSNHYGNLAYGIDAAARVYFGKPVGKLSLGECSMLAAIPQFPAMNPMTIPIWPKSARRWRWTRWCARVTSRRKNRSPPSMKNCKSRAASRRGSTSKLRTFRSMRASGWKITLDRIWWYRGGLRVYTRSIWTLNDQAQQIVSQHVKKLAEDQKHVNNGSIVVIRPKTGEILAMVGSLDYWNDEIDGKFNVATGLRQPGSSFKPFTYVTLLSQGYSPATAFLDVRTAFSSPAFRLTCRKITTASITVWCGCGWRWHAATTSRRSGRSRWPALTT